MTINEYLENFVEHLKNLEMQQIPKTSLILTGTEDLEEKRRINDINSAVGHLEFLKGFCNRASEAKENIKLESLPDLLADFKKSNTVPEIIGPETYKIAVFYHSVLNAFINVELGMWYTLAAKKKYSFDMEEEQERADINVGSLRKKIIEYKDRRAQQQAEIEKAKIEQASIKNPIEEIPVENKKEEIISQSKKEDFTNVNEKIAEIDKKIAELKSRIYVLQDTYEILLVLEKTKEDLNNAKNPYSIFDGTNADTIADLILGESKEQEMQAKREYESGIQGGYFNSEAWMNWKNLENPNNVKERLSKKITDTMTEIALKCHTEPSSEAVNDDLEILKEKLSILDSSRADFVNIKSSPQPKAISPTIMEEPKQSIEKNPSPPALKAELASISPVLIKKPEPLREEKPISIAAKPELKNISPALIEEPKELKDEKPSFWQRLKSFVFSFFEDISLLPPVKTQSKATPARSDKSLFPPDKKQSEASYTFFGMVLGFGQRQQVKKNGKDLTVPVMGTSRSSFRATQAQLPSPISKAPAPSSAPAPAANEESVGRGMGIRT